MKRPVREILTIEKPPDWSEEDWDRLDAAQKARYATNPSLYRPGQSGRARAAAGKPRAKRVGRPRKDGLPPISSHTRAVVIAEAKAAGVVQDIQQEATNPLSIPEVTTASFQVEDGDSIKGSVEVNGAKLLNDAYRRASLASSSGDPFDRAVYLTLLGKAHPMATMAESTKSLPGDAKRRKKALEALLAAHSVQDASFTPVVDGGGKEEDGDD